MKTGASPFLIAFLFVTLLIGAILTPSYGIAAKASSEASRESLGFELCFSALHGRFFQTLTEDGKLRLRQFGGLSDSEAIVTNDQIAALKKEVSSFYSATAYATPRKISRCNRPLVFKTAGRETRCLEKLKTKDSDKLLSLVSKISLASKP